MSVSELKQARSEKIYELGFHYYNKAVDGMDMLPEALNLINDIRSRFGYLLYLKQNDPQNDQISQLDAQISSDFTQLGETCYGYYTNNINLDDSLKSVCAVVASIDEQMHRGDVIAEEISKSVSGAVDEIAEEVSANVPQQPVEQTEIGKELSEDDFSMPVPEIASELFNDDADKETLFENIDTDKIENMPVKCKCGAENIIGAKFCGMCGSKLS